MYTIPFINFKNQFNHCYRARYEKYDTIIVLYHLKKMTYNRVPAPVFRHNSRSFSW